MSSKLRPMSQTTRYVTGAGLVIGTLLMVRPLAPGFDQDVGVVVAFGEGSADPEERQRKHEHLPAS